MHVQLLPFSHILPTTPHDCCLCGVEHGTGTTHKGETSTDTVDETGTARPSEVSHHRELTPEPPKSPSTGGEFLSPSWVVVDGEDAATPWVQVGDALNISGTVVAGLMPASVRASMAVKLHA